ncbi:bifunctional riboflavin kinase/FAD synthetase [Novosphingobium sp. MMS21-SN21R]|uniref:bifunctional riboflavin kinase/FAD synthetase n=1 Tax=Novosphingobium sp. MMS21-SN21R TaxID=2969298 RepID=UPI0028861BE0|nr:bifunctional riboflavin kinase/FAD synthetase [Novosphingobium sp. MMS21-SN21R]MDT0509393.1 bifunctional riboflavin kinase/FAD synthetase [Novosphingobium sp. MMS21-SN21R]
MIRLGSLDPVPEALRGAIIALGNFDGFHLGHQAVVGEAIRWARAEGRPAIVATFDPHPVRYFAPNAAPFRLTTLDQRQDLFAAAGADAMLVIHFGAEVAGLAASAWIEQGLVGHLGAAGVVTGDDFTFGKGRSGNPQVLVEQGAKFGLRAKAVGAVTLEGEAVSSSRIRHALQSGDCETATRLLTRPFAIRGVVQHGDKVGRTINFPTANLDIGAYLRPRYGIYAVTGRLPDGRTVKGAANIGIRPTFDPPKELLEPHFFDFSEDLYGQEIEVAFHHFLRPEAKYEGLDALVAQIARDCDQARALLG